MIKYLLLFMVIASSSFAGVGDIYIARAPATSLISNNSLASAVTLTYDTEVATSSIINRETGNQAFRILESGRYLIITSTGWDYQDIGANRHVVRTNVKLGGSNLTGISGMSSGYGRDAGDADESHVITISYIDHTVVGSSADDITVEVQNFGDTGVALADQFVDASAIMIVRMPDDAAWLQLTRTNVIPIAGGGMTTTRATPATFSTLPYENQIVETDSSVIEWVSGADVTLKEAGHYLVLIQILAKEEAHRIGMTTKLMLNNAEINGGVMTTSFMRVTDGAVDSWTSLGVILEVSANDILTVDSVNDSQTNTEDPDLIDMNLTVVRLPDSADYVRIYHAPSRAGETIGVFPQNTEDEDDGNLHSTSTNTHRINGTSDADDWLFLAAWYLSVNQATTTRTTEHFRWVRTGTLFPYGSGLSYTRGSDAFESQGVYNGGRSAAIIVDNLGAAEWVALNLRMESGTGSLDRDFVANRVGISALNLSSMVPAAGAARRVIVVQ